MGLNQDRAAARRDAGFGLLEAVIALSIIFMLIVTLLRTFDITVTVVSQTGRRASANALASELLERARSLEWEHMGLTANANGSTCPDDVGCSTLPPSIADEISTNTAGNYTFEGEEIVFANGTTFDPFLSFADTVDRAGVDYNRFLFVTSIRTDPADPATESARRIVAVVRWVAPDGLPEETRLATLVTEFTEPSQPFIHGELNFDGGYASIRGSASACAGAPDCGAAAPGTAAWGGSYPARPDFTVDLTLPDGYLSATSDYISSAISRYTGPSADVREAGADGLLGTDDDDLSSVAETQQLKVVDDDASSLPVENDPYVWPIFPVLFNASGTPPHDIVIADLHDHGDLDLIHYPHADFARVRQSAWTEHDIDPSVAVVDDGLPYAFLEGQSAETTRVGYVEYSEANFRNFYTTVLGGTLSHPAYEFTLARFGDSDLTEALFYSGVVDRFDDASGNRQAITNATWAGEQIRFLDDTVQRLNPSHHSFRGWVIVQLPTFKTVSSVAAGESATSSPAITVSSDLIVRFWDAAAAQYRTAFNGYGAMTCDSAQTVSFTSLGAIGGPQVHTSATGLHPKLRFEVDAEVTIRKFCPTVTLDGASVAGSFVQTHGFLTGSLEYKVVDEIVEADGTFDGVLFDLGLDFDAGGLDAGALFFDPNA